VPRFARHPETAFFHVSFGASAPMGRRSGFSLSINRATGIIAAGAFVQRLDSASDLVGGQVSIRHVVTSFLW